MSRISATTVTLDDVKYADIVTELAGDARTGGADFNLSRWTIAPADELCEFPVLNYLVSIRQRGGSGYTLLRFVTRADALEWIEETHGPVSWVDMSNLGAKS